MPAVAVPGRRRHDAGMPFAVELTLERETARPVRRIWRRLAKAGIRYMTDSRADPHVTLGVWDDLAVVRSVDVVSDLARTTAPVPVTFTGVRTFGAGVIFLAPEASRRLTALQARVWADVDPLAVGAWPNYAAGAWVPHCTLAMELGAVDVEAALAIANTIALPLDGHADRLSIVEFRPLRERHSFPLTGA